MSRPGVVVSFEGGGFDTYLPNHVRLAGLLRDHGAPLRIVAGLVEWSPIAPGLPEALAPSYLLRNPWGDGRRIVGVRLA